MRVLIVGGGGREHALAWACAQHGGVDLICAPGNGGTSSIATNVVVDTTDAGAVAAFAVQRRVDLVVIGPDAAAAAGLADACAQRGVPVFGPTAAAARIESSKAFAKQLMDDAGIPTARWISGSSRDRGRLRKFIADLGGACVVKADGLALGKGVLVCDSGAEAEQALAACFDEGRFGAAGTTVVVEERLRGPELSMLGLCDGTRLRVLQSARDHKRLLDGDRGPNTGGMGAVAPAPDVDDALVESVTTDVLQPCVDALKARGTPFVGCLYAGLMLTPAGPRVLEFNARFGDPEAQVLLPQLDESALDLFVACARGSVDPGYARFKPGATVGVVAAAAGYPGDVRSGDVVTGLDALDADVLVFHAGTRQSDDGALRTSGGRVLCVVARGADSAAARHHAYENLDRVRFDGMHYRRDIGAAVSALSTAAP